MDFTGSSSDWNHGYRSGPALNSDDPSEDIRQHDKAAAFKWHLSQAKGGSALNPFVTENAATDTTSTAPTPNVANGASGGSGGPSASQNRMVTAHGVLAALAFVALFPIGGILICLGNFTGLIWVHAALQAVAYLIYVGAFGLGVYIATSSQQITNVHAIIGIVLFIVLLFQPILGWMHHRVFKKTGGRSIWTWGHLSIGRVAVLLGMINGGLGLRLAGAGKSAKIAYAVVTAVVGMVYIAVMLFGEMRRKKAQTQKEDLRLELSAEESYKN
ncbi:hypothetical protein LTR08_003502 [Meristemomyces frigidus]|nr:hypothetical protein LTR08_003502 [Meristemomyces frigidus]